MHFQGKMAKFFLLFLCFIFMINTSNADIVISEIMYNPDGDEYDFEFIELFGKEDNISGYYFEGIDFVFPQNSSIDGYLVIANTLNHTGENNDFRDRYPEIECYYEYKGTLLNTGETIILRDDKGEIADVVSYDDWTEENCSLERVDLDGYSSDPSNWAESPAGGTPGKENSCRAKQECDWELIAIIENKAGEDIEWQIRASKLKGEGKANITIKHWIEDSYGTAVRDYSDILAENSLRQKTSNKYSPRLDKGEGYFIKANITKISCKDSDESNNFLSELVYVMERKGTVREDSDISIEKVTPNDIRFGDTLKVHLDIYKGNTSKYAAYSYAEDEEGKRISEISTLHIKGKFINQSLTVPVQLKPDCKEKYENGDYIIVAEGLGTRAEKEISINGINSRLCKEVKVEAEKKEKRGKLDFEITKMPLTVYLNESFNVELDIENNYDDDIRLEVWSYVYRGAKKYSAEKDNLEYVKIEEDERRKIIMKNKVVEGEEGYYKLKVKIKKEGRKTLFEERKQIYLNVPEISMEKSEKLTLLSKEEKDEEKYDEKADAELKETNIANTENGSVIYESGIFFVKGMIPVFLIFLFLLAIGVSLYRLRDKT
ncbi:hypothetical protein GF323_06415 [Candidatus Woesearchaeota archaeon]|nr:hypothetical protein [Candidatus Woesearchaeota archaeon]